MNTKQMEYIIELAQTLNFNRAAENLYISQPTLTYQIKAVEGEIGFAIFERSGKGAMLTPAGAQFVSTLRTVYGQLKAAIEQGQNFSALYARRFTSCHRLWHSSATAFLMSPSFPVLTGKMARIPSCGVSRILLLPWNTL